MSESQEEHCIHCREPITYWHGDLWCHTPNGFTASPLRRAQPAFHPAGATL